MEKIIKGIFFILVLIFLLLAINLYRNLIAEPEYFKNLEDDEKDLQIQDTGADLQFYRYMRFQSLPIKYKIDASCDAKKNERLWEALSFFVEETNLSFVEVDEREYIFISCSAENNQQIDNDMFIAGEGGPIDIVETGLFHLILKSKVLLFNSSECEKPNIAIHEILHALGFKHSGNENSILYPIVNCNQKISWEVMNEIEEIYSHPSLPDLKIQSVNASKKGRYLDFEVWIKNQGLGDAQSVNLSLSYGGNDLDFLEVDDISAGGTKILRVQGLRVPSKIESLVFLADPDDKIQEIYEDNNELQVYTEQYLR